MFKLRYDPNKSLSEIDHRTIASYRTTIANLNQKAATMLIRDLFMNSGMNVRYFRGFDQDYDPRATDNEVVSHAWLLEQYMPDLIISDMEKFNRFISVRYSIDKSHFFPKRLRGKNGSVLEGDLWPEAIYIVWFIEHDLMVCVPRSCWAKARAMEDPYIDIKDCRLVSEVFTSINTDFIALMNRFYHYYRKAIVDTTNELKYIDFLKESEEFSR